MNVLELVQQENEKGVMYPDEKIISNLYYVSFSYSLRALEGLPKEQKEEKEKRNEWLKEKSKFAEKTPVLNFDRIAEQLKDEGRCSCDALFYHTCPGEGERHYLAEFKQADKKMILTLMKNLGKDGIYSKIHDSVELIKKELEFGGRSEHEDIIAHMHFFMVYAGKNNVAAANPVTLPRKMAVSRDNCGKQKSAGRMNFDSGKAANEIYEQFGERLKKLGLEGCEEKTFPGNALPCAKKRKGGGKERSFSIFSASDFAQIIDSGFFASWNWGEYDSYFQ